MPWMCLHNGKKKAPRQVPEDVEVECPECREEMSVVKAHMRGDSLVSRHFRHKSGGGAVGETGGGSAACESVHESDEHMVWKSMAADRLESLFAGNLFDCQMELMIEAPTSEKDYRQADAAVIFEERDTQLGQGVVVEVQYRNNSKDIEAVTEDYLEQDLSVVWADADDFGERRMQLAEVDIRTRAFEAIWPEHVPPKSAWESETDYIPNIVPESSVPATLPPEFFDAAARELWERQEWLSLFSPPEPRFLFRQGGQTEVPCRFPPELVDEVAQQLWENTQWLDIAKPYQFADRYTKIEKEHVVIPVTVPEPVAGELWKAVAKRRYEDPPKKPPTPFDDVQCVVCGSYWPVSKERTTCSSCGAAVDFEWNYRTGRISDIPDYTD